MKGDSEPAEGAFLRASRRRQSGDLAQLWNYISETGKWWLIPILLALLIVGVLALLNASGAGLFVYPIF